MNRIMYENKFGHPCTRISSSCPSCSARHLFDVNEKTKDRCKEVCSIRCTVLRDMCVQGSEFSQIKAHLSKYPLSASSTDRFGRSPLYWAIKVQRCQEIIRHLYNSAPDMLLSPDIYGKTCLDLLYAPQTANASILCWLLEQDPSVVLSCSSAPFALPLLHRVCIRWSLSSLENDALDLEIVLMTIKAAHRYLFCDCNHKCGRKEQIVPFLHMALNLGLPAIVLQKIASFFPEDMHARLCYSQMTPFQYFLSHYSPTDDHHAVVFLLHILDINRQAAQERFTSFDGKSIFALHIAIKSGYAWKSMHALERLVQAAPWVLYEIDEETRLLPFQLAASANCFVGETIQLDAIYSLFRAEPAVIFE